MFRRTTLLRLVGLLVLLGLVTSSALAQERSSTVSLGSAKIRHCVVHIDPVKPGQTVSTMSSSTCFARFSDAIAFATGGTVRLPSSFSPDQFTPDILSGPSPATTTVIGEDFSDSGHSGSTLTWTSSTGGCSSTQSFQAASMPSGWNDVISSAYAFQNCNHNVHFENVKFNASGPAAKIDCGTSCSSMGAMNDKTSSEKWRH